MLTTDALCQTCTDRYLSGPSSMRLLEERRFNLPRRVQVEHDDHWWPGFQSRWRLCDDDRG